MADKFKAAIVVLAVALSACGTDDDAPAERSNATTPTTSECTNYGGECNLTVYEKDGVKCAVYQAGGPNSARMWCADMTAATGGEGDE